MRLPNAAIVLALIVASFVPRLSVAQDALIALNFEQPGLSALSAGVKISTQFTEPDQVPGVVGKAWRADGFSSWASLPIDLSGSAGFTFSAWLALESFPSDLEVPVDRLSPSSIAHQRDGSKGFDIFIDTYGRWGLWAAVGRQKMQLNAPDRFPLYQWAHIVATVDTDANIAALYLNGSQVIATKLKENSAIDFADTPLELARSHSEVGYLNFTFNRLNAAYDDVEVYDRALSADEVKALRASYSGQIPDAMASLIVPKSRFANDHLRPRLRAMPPANWTNEPHGMVRKDDTWHLFYQRTPNGPYKTQMHWGHMASDDLVTWRHLPDALWPELQDDRFSFDQKGIWSGDVIVEGDTAFAFYTSVNHFNRLTASNPGVSMAVSKDPELRHWQKMGPIINSKNVNDFRDPYLWREGNIWHMIVGAAIDSGGGLDYHVLEVGEDGGKWVPRERFSAISYRILDIGSDIWEMPVFEPLTDDVHVLVVNPIGGRVSKYGDSTTRGVYWAGEWRDGLFHPFEKKPKMLDIIPGHLAPTVARGKDGQLRAIGIVDERRTPQAQEDAGWAHTYSLPRSWFLMPDGRTMGQAPAPEVAALRGDAVMKTKPQHLDAGPLAISSGMHAYELEIKLTCSESGAALALDILMSPDGEEFTQLVFHLGENEVTLDLSQSTMSAEGEGPSTYSGIYDASAFGEIRTIRAFVDGSVVDVFINDAAAFAFRSYPARKDSTGVQVSAVNGSIELAGTVVWPLEKPE